MQIAKVAHLLSWNKRHSSVSFSYTPASVGGTCVRASASGWLDTAPLLYAGSAYAVQWINSRREYPAKKGCAIMALTVEEVIRMLDDAYEDNSDDDLGIDIVEQENQIIL